MTITKGRGLTGLLLTGSQSELPGVSCSVRPHAWEPRFTGKPADRR